MTNTTTICQTFLLFIFLSQCKCSNPTARCMDITAPLLGNGVANIVPDDIYNGLSDPDGESIIKSISQSSDDIDNGSSDPDGDIIIKSISQSSFDCSHVGANSVTLTVTNANSDTDTCTSTVTVEDNVAPVCITAPFTVQLDANGVGSVTSDNIDGGSTDVCGIANLSVSPNQFSCQDVGENMVTLTVTDNNGEVSTCVETVTVEDNVAPVCITAPFTVQLDANGVGSVTSDNIDGGSTDVCGIANLSVSPNQFSCQDVGENMVTLTVTDNNGEVSTCVETVTVEDSQGTCVSDAAAFTEQLDANGVGSITPDHINVGIAIHFCIMTVSMFLLNVGLYFYFGCQKNNVESSHGTNNNHQVLYMN
eukprot:113725_1